MIIDPEWTPSPDLLVRIAEGLSAFRQDHHYAVKVADAANKILDRQAAKAAKDLLSKLE